MAPDVLARDTRGVGALVRASARRRRPAFHGRTGRQQHQRRRRRHARRLGLALADATAHRRADADGLGTLARVDASKLDPRLADRSITVMSDVNNPLCGALGATAVFGPQKGVRPDEIARVDAAGRPLRRARRKASAATPQPVPAPVPPAVWASRCSSSARTFRSGAAVVADLIGLDAALEGADWALTGEGSSDAQTLLAKAPFVVAQRARARGVGHAGMGAVDATALPALAQRIRRRVRAGTRTGDTGRMPAPRRGVACRAEQLARTFAAGRRT